MERFFEKYIGSPYNINPNKPNHVHPIFIEKIDTSVLRVLNDNFSVRTGKYGPYVYYKRASMAKPIFYNIKKFKESFTYCNADILIKWICDTYNIESAE